MPLVGSIPDGIVGVPYTYQVQQSDVAAFFFQVFGPAANLPPFTFVNLGPPYPNIPLGDFLTGLAIPGMTISSSGLINGTPTVAGNYVPVCEARSQPNPSPPPPAYAVQVLIVNGWRITAASSGARYRAM